MTDAGGLPSTMNSGPYYPGPNPYPNPYCTDPYDNEPPEAGFEYSPTKPKPGDEVTFTSTSTDPDGDALRTGWDFDGDWDPTSATPFAGIDQFEAEARHTYASPGDYRVRMGVLDPCGAGDVIDGTVRVEAPPEASAPPPVQEPPPAGGATQDTIGPFIVISRAINRIRRVSRRGVFTFVLGPFAEDVRGTISFESLRAVVSQARRKLRIRRRAISATKGKRLVVRVRLPRRGLRALRRRERIRMRAHVVLRDAAGNATTRSFRFTLVAPKRTGG